ncbi:XRE family transcriptional regulator [Georgenia phoenicis]|uniref:helix-turn-helix domain-containing protein n=1 Tax=unclassified Georgenia TaxID=2626815 RepID=UPI0039B0E232
MSHSAAGQDALDVGALGAVVRRSRQRMGLSVEALAARSGLSTGLLSQLERGRGNPSLQTLSRLAGALGTQLVSLLQSAQRHGDPIVRADSRLVLADVEPGQEDSPRPVRELLTPDQNLPLQLIRTVMPPGFSNAARPFRHLGLESVHVLSGRLDVVLGEARHELGAGDTITYECSQAHWWANPSATEETVVIGAVAPFAG